jgi:hypothetical protein
MEVMEVTTMDKYKFAVEALVTIEAENEAEALKKLDKEDYNTEVVLLEVVEAQK